MPDTYKMRLPIEHSLRQEAGSLAPGFYSLGTVLSFPCLENSVVAALGLYDLTVVWVFVNLDLTWLASCLLLNLESLTTSTCLWIKDVDHIAKAVAVLTKQCTKFVFKLHFGLDGAIVFHGLQLGELLGKLQLEATEFSKT